MEDLFWYGKGFVALTATLMLAWHMYKNGDEITDIDQWCRFVLLFGYTLLVAVASPDQAQEHIDIQPRNVASLCLSAFGILTAYLSLRASKRRKQGVG